MTCIRVQEILDARNRVIERHPHTTFVALHVANWPENLDAVSGWLDKYPNMMVEFGAREAELGRSSVRNQAGPDRRLALCRI